MTRILYFSRSYTPHDHRFLSALAETPHTVAFLQLEPAKRTTERGQFRTGLKCFPRWVVSAPFAGAMCRL